MFLSINVSPNLSCSVYSQQIYMVNIDHQIQYSFQQPDHDIQKVIFHSPVLKILLSQPKNRQKFKIPTIIDRFIFFNDGNPRLSGHFHISKWYIY